MRCIQDQSEIRTNCSRKVREIESEFWQGWRGPAGGWVWGVGSERGDEVDGDDWVRGEEEKKEKNWHERTEEQIEGSTRGPRGPKNNQVDLC